MKDRRTLMRIVLLVAAAALLVLAAKSVGVKRATSIATTQEIENLLAGLDPATRASVVRPPDRRRGQAYQRTADGTRELTPVGPR